MYNSISLRNSFRALTVAGILALTAFAGTSCVKDDAPSSSSSCSDCTKASLTVGIATPSTKSTTISSDDEVKVNNLQVLVFRGDELDAYGSVNNQSSLTLSCTSGDRVVYALVNAPSLSGISSKTALLSQVSLLSGNGVDSFQMIGSKEVSLPAASTVSIDVRRFASRISLKKITRNFSSSALASLPFTVDAIYAINVAGDLSYGGALGGEFAPTVWHNQMAYTDALSEFTHDSVGESIENSSSYSTVHNFYCYPNPTSEDESAGTWSPRHTRLVIETTLGGRKYYYPITLPVMEKNCSYEISELTLTRPGSDDPDTPVSFSDCTFEISVQPWTAVPVTEGTTI